MTTASNDTKVWIRASGGQVWHLATGARLQELAMRWNSVVRNRERWDNDGGSTQLEERARLDLNSIGLTESIRGILMEIGVGEIGMTWTRDEGGWEEQRGKNAKGAC